MSTKCKFSVFNDEDDDNSSSNNEAQNKTEETLAFQRGSGGSTCFVSASVNHQTEDSPSEPWREHSVQRIEKTVRNRLLYNLSPAAALVVQGRLQVSWITDPTKPDILSITGGTDSKRLERFDLAKLYKMLDDIDSENVTFICDLSAIAQGAQSIKKEKVTVLRANAYAMMPIVIGDRVVDGVTMLQRGDDAFSNHFVNFLKACSSHEIEHRHCKDAWEFDDRMVIELAHAIRHSRSKHIVVFMRDEAETCTSSTKQTVMGNTKRINQVLSTLSTSNKSVEIWMWSENCTRATEIKKHARKEKLSVTIKCLELFRSLVLFTSVGKPVENFIPSQKVLKTCVHARSSNENTLTAPECSDGSEKNTSDTSVTESSMNDDDSSVDCKTSCSEDEHSTATSAFVFSRFHKALPDNRALMLQMVTCPLTGKVVQDPVLAPCGHHFERSSIEQRLLSKSHCIVCNEPIHKSQLYPCAALKAIASLLGAEI